MNDRVAILLDHQSMVDTRVYRTAHTLAEAGYETRIFAAGRHDTSSEDVCPNLTRQCLRVSLWRRRRPAIAPLAVTEADRLVTTTDTPGAPSLIARIKSQASNAFHFQAYYRAYRDPVRDFAPTIIHANDLNTLPAGARLAGQTGAKLIYDSHEYEADRNHTTILPAWVLRHRQRAERKYAPSAHTTITVSDGIADCMRDNLGISRPQVILNTPDIEDAAMPGADTSRDPSLLLHVGLLRPGRFQEICVDALQYLPDHHLRFVGPRLPGYREVLQERAIRLGVDARLQFVDAIPSEALMEELKQAFASLVLMPDTNLSCELALPNKLFESLAAGTPVVASNRTEMRKIVKTLHCGTLLDEHTADGLADAIKQLANESPAQFTLPQRYRFAAQKEKLLTIYRQLT